MEGVGTEVITLSLEQVGGKVLGAVSVEPRKSSGESGCGNTELDSLGNNVPPSGLSGVDSLVEEVVEEQVLKIGVLAVGVGDVLEENGTDDATTTPHEGNRRLVELPSELLSSLSVVSINELSKRSKSDYGKLTSCISMKPWAYETILEA